MDNISIYVPKNFLKEEKSWKKKQNCFYQIDKKFKLKKCSEGSAQTTGLIFTYGIKNIIQSCKCKKNCGNLWSL